MQTRSWSTFRCCSTTAGSQRSCSRSRRKFRRYWRRRSRRGNERKFYPRSLKRGSNKIAVFDDAESDWRSKAPGGPPHPWEPAEPRRRQFPAAPKNRDGRAIDMPAIRKTPRPALQRAESPRAGPNSISSGRRSSGIAGIDRKRADASPAQFNHMSITAERPAEVTRDRAHIRTNLPPSASSTA